MPLRPIRIESLYWEIDEMPNIAKSGICIINIEEDEGCYIVPEYEYPGLIKVCMHIHNYTYTCSAQNNVNNCRHDLINMFVLKVVAVFGYLCMSNYFIHEIQQLSINTLLGK